QEEKLQAGALSVFAQHVGDTEQFGNALDHGQNLIPANKSIQAGAEIRFSGKSAGNAQREANFRLAASRASDRRQTDVVDFGIGAPGVASGDRDLELARQVVELGVSSQE